MRAAIGHIVPRTSHPLGQFDPCERWAGFVFFNIWVACLHHRVQSGPSTGDSDPETTARVADVLRAAASLPLCVLLIGRLARPQDAHRCGKHPPERTFFRALLFRGEFVAICLLARVFAPRPPSPPPDGGVGVPWRATLCICVTAIRLRPERRGLHRLCVHGPTPNGDQAFDRCQGSSRVPRAPTSPASLLRCSPRLPSKYRTRPARQRSATAPRAFHS